MAENETLFVDDKALALCHKIEDLPASELQTEISIMASEQHERIQLLKKFVTYVCIERGYISVMKAAKAIGCYVEDITGEDIPAETAEQGGS